MTRQEALTARYEDAVFVLLLNEVAESEGRRALEENERLQECGEAAVPEEVRRRCRNVILRGSAGKELRRLDRGFRKVLTKVALVALMAALVFTTVFAVSPKFRGKTIDFVMEVFDDRAEIRFAPGDGTEDDGPVPEMTVGWLPEGFVLTRDEEHSSARLYEYLGPDEAAISVSIMELIGAGMAIDTEGAEMLECRVQGQDALLVDKGRIKQLMWKLDRPGKWYCWVITEQVSRADMLAFAEGAAVR